MAGLPSNQQPDPEIQFQKANFAFAVKHDLNYIINMLDVNFYSEFKVFKAARNVLDQHF